MCIKGDTRETLCSLWPLKSSRPCCLVYMWWASTLDVTHCRGRSYVRLFSTLRRPFQPQHNPLPALATDTTPLPGNLCYKIDIAPTQHQPRRLEDKLAASVKNGPVDLSDSEDDDGGSDLDLEVSNHKAVPSTGTTGNSRTSAWQRLEPLLST